MTSTGPVIGRTIAESTPYHEPVPRPPEGAPNVLVIVLDDLGFGQLGCFGSDIATPNIDRLAEGGLRYTSFHVTSLCSPTRASLLTGRNHHAIGMGFLTDVPIGFPGYDGRIPTGTPTLPRVMTANGYSAYAVGKWHLAPRWDQSASGPFDRWPLGLGFERYYGFLGGDANQWTPELVSDNGFVDPPTTPDEGYHLTEDLADRTIRLLQDQHQATPNRPFLMYLATGAMHAPHHAPQEWIDRYAGAFDDGWERWRESVFDRQVATGIVPEDTTLPERPSWVPDWDTLEPDQQRVYARMMEAFAGFLSHTDAQIGRVLDHLEQSGQLDDTLVLLISDNGASAEGGPQGSLNEHRFTHDLQDDPASLVERIDDIGGHRAYNHYAWGWAWAGNTPFRLWKRYAWLGGVRTPLIVHWPNGIAARGEVRDQFCHVIDLMPTVLASIGIDRGAGIEATTLDGAPLGATFDDAAAPSPRDTQYFEMLGSRSLYHDGWKVTTDHVGPGLTVEVEQIPGSHDFEDDHWALFDLRADPSESRDVSAEHPEKVEELVARWWSEAERNQVLPLSDAFLARAVALTPNPEGWRSAAVIRPGGGPVNEDALPPMGGGFRITATVEVGSDASGVVAALGDWHNGWALHLVDGVPAFVMSLFGDPVSVVADGPLATGRREITVLYEREPGGAGGGPVVVGVDGAEVAAGRIPADLPFRWQIGGGGVAVGHDRGFPVVEGAYRPPARFDGEVETVVIESLALMTPELRREIRAALHRE